MPASDPFILVRWASQTDPNRAIELLEGIEERVISVSATDKARGADDLTVTLRNIDLALLDEPRLAPGNILLVQWGFRDEIGPTWRVTIQEVTGPITKLQIKGVATQELEFIREEFTRTWEAKTAAEVAEEIAEEMGYNDEIMRIEYEGLLIRSDIIQTNQTNYNFLLGLAQEEDYIFRITGGVFHFHRPKLDESPITTLTYWQGGDSPFTQPPTISAGTLGIPGRVTRRGHSTRERTTVEATASNENDTSRVSQGVIYVPDPRNHQVLQRQERRPRAQQRPQAQGSTGPTSEDTESGAQRQAQTRFRQAERRAIEMNLSLKGMPNLTADTTIRLEGLGEKLTGNYYVEEVSHNVSEGGYTTKAKVKRNARSRAASDRSRQSANRREALQAMDREVEQWEAQRDSGDITSEEYTQRVRAQQARRQNLLDNADERTSGRRNEQRGSGESRQQDELERRWVPDRDNPQVLRQQFRQRGRSSDG